MKYPTSTDTLVRAILRIVLMILPLLSPVTWAHEENLIEEMVVYGRAEGQIGSANAASQGKVGYDDVNLPPMLRVGELVELVPGMVATQHSGTGKANQYFVRGFNLDHGTDFSVSTEGVPINMRSHAHGQGYIDLNFLIPELVESASYYKGPYRADRGDFASAAAVEFKFYDRLDRDFVSAKIGTDDYYRGFVAFDHSVGDGANWLFALDSTQYEGPWELDENSQQHRLYSSYLKELSEGLLKITAQYYDGSWDSTDQIPLRAVRSGEIDELGYVDPDLGGRTERFALSGALQFSNWHLTAYFIDYSFNLFSNFTYFLNDPLLGDEFEQADRRRIYGGHVTNFFEVESFPLPLTVKWSVGGRYDDINHLGLYGTQARERHSVIRRDKLSELSIDGYLQAQLELTERLRMSTGVRADWYDWDVNARRSENSGSGDDTIVSPNLSLAYQVSPNLELYGNWGRGFHSNDIRGTVQRVDPIDGSSVQPVDALVESEGYEIGMRFESGSRFNAAVTYFWIDLDSELLFVGDAGATEPNDASKRDGVETSLFWQVTEQLSVNASYTNVDARYAGDCIDCEIPGAVDETLVLGGTLSLSPQLSFSTKIRYLGAAPLVEDASVKNDSSVLLNFGLVWTNNPVEVRLDVLNALDTGKNDIAYFYESRLPGEPAEGITDTHFHPLEPRAVRASLRWYL